MPHPCPACTAAHCAVILLNYRNAPDTIACLRALAAMPVQPGKIIVIDNSSPDDSVKRIMAAWQTSTEPVLLREEPAHAPLLPTSATRILLARSTNDGFSAGNNAAIRLALQDSECKAVWLLNNDTDPEPDALNALCQRMSADPQPGIVGSTLIYAHNRSTVQTLAGGRLNSLLGTTHSFGGGMELPEALRQWPQHRVEQQLDDIIGASMFIRRATLVQTGYLDEAFFLYGEETEFCIRVRKAGFNFAWAPESVVYHKEGGSTGAESAAEGRKFRRPAWVDYLSLRNRVYMMRKHYPWALPLVLLSYLGVILNRVRRGQANRIPLIFRAAWDGLRGRMGKPDHLFPALRDTHENSGH
ncbi:MAG: glycosyltransferase family 2 protein [Desulfovibrio sp.]|uniref:glycosyltransferase family 2 protein n=1 Tax=Desulfovibrio sp. TaxID=885 RepID=UPI002A36F315|nr:glycosyltransferase family 2 protein [Desulfovibrio sp.]MDY0260219.1 glycosyltransferase family 2 protein [Desulfovibrio sp.]